MGQQYNIGEKPTVLLFSVRLVNSAMGENSVLMFTEYHHYEKRWASPRHYTVGPMLLPYIGEPI